MLKPWGKIKLLFPEYGRRKNKLMQQNKEKWYVERKLFILILFVMFMILDAVDTDLWFFFYLIYNVLVNLLNCTLISDGLMSLILLRV